MSYLDQIEDVRQGYLQRFDTANAEKRDEYDKSSPEFLIQVPGKSKLLGGLFRFDIAGLLDGNVKISDTHGNAADLAFTMEGLSGTPIIFRAFAWNCAIFRTPGLMMPQFEIESWFERWIGAEEVSAQTPKSIQDMSAWFDRREETGAEHRGFIHGVSRTSDDQIVVDFGTASLSAFDELLLILESAGAPEMEIDAGTDMPIFDEAVAILQRDSLGGPGLPEEPAAPEPAPSPEPAPRAEPAPDRPRIEGAEAFFAWFAENGVRLAALADRRPGESAETGETDEAQETEGTEASGGGLAEVEREISAELAKVDDGLDCEVRPGEQRRFALVFSPKRQAALVPVALGLAEQAPDLTDWEFRAFRAARPLTEPLEVWIPADGSGGDRMESLRVDPKAVQLSIKPKVCRLDFVLYLGDVARGAESRIGHAAPQLLEAALGERGYIEGVAGLTVGSYPDDDVEAVTLDQASSQFAKHSASLRMAFRKLTEGTAETAVATCLERLDDDLEALETTLTEFGPYEPIRLSLSFWGSSRDQKSSLENAFPDFEVWAAPAVSLVGQGFEFEAEGVCPVSGGDLGKWLAERALALFDEGLVLMRLAEQEVAPLGMEQLIDSRATALMSEGQWADAATMLRPLLERIGESEEGRIHAKAGLCYLRAGHAQPAIPLLQTALAMVTDTGLMGQVHNYLGIALQEVGDIEDAYLQFQKSVALDPSIGARHYNLGQYYALLGDPEQASKHLREAIERDPDMLTLLLEDEDLEPFRKTSWFRKLKKLKVAKARSRGAKGRDKDRSGRGLGRIFGRLKKSA